MTSDVRPGVLRRHPLASCQAKVHLSRLTAVSTSWATSSLAGTCTQAGRVHAHTCTCRRMGRGVHASWDECMQMLLHVDASACVCACACMRTHARVHVHVCAHTDRTEMSIDKGLRHGVGHGVGRESVCATEAHGAWAHAAGARGNSGDIYGRGEREQRRYIRQGREGAAEIYTAGARGSSGGACGRGEREQLNCSRTQWNLSVVTLDLTHAWQCIRSCCSPHVDIPDRWGSWAGRSGQVRSCQLSRLGSGCEPGHARLGSRGTMPETARNCKPQAKPTGNGLT